MAQIVRSVNPRLRTPLPSPSGEGLGMGPSWRSSRAARNVAGTLADMTLIRSLVSGLTLLSAVASCVPPGVNCTLEARGSLAVRVVDDSGAGVSTADVSAVHDGESVVCEASGDDGAYDCGFFEVSGDFVVTVEAGAFRRSEQVTVGETDDGCHVVPESLTFQVPADSGCCCAFIRPGDGDIISEEPAQSSAECAARDQGSCVDPDVVAQRLTPHACCPDATGERCGN